VPADKARSVVAKVEAILAEPGDAKYVILRIPNEFPEALIPQAISAVEQFLMGFPQMVRAAVAAGAVGRTQN